MQGTIGLLRLLCVKTEGVVFLNTVDSCNHGLHASNEPFAKAVLKFKDKNPNIVPMTCGRWQAGQQALDWLRIAGKPS
jgi:hypothetical protein